MEIENISQKDKEWLEKQQPKAKRFFRSFAVYSMCLSLLFLFSYLSTLNECKKALWGYRAFIFFLFSCVCWGTADIIDKYLKIIEKLMEK